MKSFATFVFFCLFAFSRLQAQPASNAPPVEPDVLLFINGEKLIGHLVSAQGSDVVFKSDMAGEVTVDWSRIKELKSAGKFAVIPKGVVLSKREGVNQVPQGTITMTEQKLEVNPGGPAPPRTLAVADVTNVVEEDKFQSAFHRQRFDQGWKGGATFGVAITDATQTSQTYTAALNMVRSVPAESWIDMRSRT